jgi:hypothetical protein
MKRVAKYKPITTDLRRKIKRLIVLNDAHSEAIRNGDAAFYEDGRHAELVALFPEVHTALGIKPWHDDREMLTRALEDAA